jgi:hypothetical protein
VGIALAQTVSHVPIAADALMCDPRPVSVKFVLGKVSPVQVFLQVLRFSPVSIITQLLSTHSSVTSSI